jgi:hypothetical protein
LVIVTTLPEVGVGVPGTGVLVGGTGVLVGGTGVLVDPGTDVAGIGVGVLVAVGVDVGPEVGGVEGPLALLQAIVRVRELTLMSARTAGEPQVTVTWSSSLGPSQNGSHMREVGFSTVRDSATQTTLRDWPLVKFRSPLSW